MHSLNKWTALVGICYNQISVLSEYSLMEDEIARQAMNRENFAGEDLLGSSCMKRDTTDLGLEHSK